MTDEKIPPEVERRMMRLARMRARILGHVDARCESIRNGKEPTLDAATRESIGYQAVTAEVEKKRKG